jgi:hypothetical protein
VAAITASEQWASEYLDEEKLRPTEDRWASEFAQSAIVPFNSADTSQPAAKWAHEYLDQHANWAQEYQDLTDDKKWADEFVAQNDDQMKSTAKELVDQMNDPKFANSEVLHAHCIADNVMTYSYLRVSSLGHMELFSGNYFDGFFSLCLASAIA